MEHFENGFIFAVQRFIAGDTVEVLSHHPKYLEYGYYGRGMFAACEAITGWIAVAEREACLHGFSRESAAALVQRGLHLLAASGK